MKNATKYTSALNDNLEPRGTCKTVRKCKWRLCTSNWGTSAHSCFVF